MSSDDIEFFKSIGVTFGSDGPMGDRYTMFCCEQAILIAETLRTKEKIIAFFENKSWDGQRSMVPSISEDHSGNTFNMSCRLAINYIPMLRDKRIDDILR